MALDDSIRERVVLMGGKVAGVDCPHCEFHSREIDVDPASMTAIHCPECHSPILSRNHRSQLRQADKLRMVAW